MGRKKIILLAGLVALGCVGGCGAEVAEPASTGFDVAEPDADVLHELQEPEVGEVDVESGDESNGGDAVVDEDVAPAFAPSWDDSTPLGGDRPALTFLPDDYETTKQWPVVIMLHGYSANAALQNVYFGLESHTTSHGYIGIAPDGLRDSLGNRFWNATDACCDGTGNGVDDVAYLTALIDEAEERLAVDPERIYFVGHSNGGFMSYRMACELGSRIAALASVAGATFYDADDCRAPGHTGVLQVHGTLDAVILYLGGWNYGSRYPGAEAT
ncbi:MAG: alpha/beta hydrolase family esterase, partial [Bradymonadaceae bacterium]